MEDKDSYGRVTHYLSQDSSNLRDAYVTDEGYTEAPSWIVMPSLAIITLG